MTPTPTLPSSNASATAYVIYHVIDPTSTPLEYRILTLGHSNILDLIDRTPLSQLCTIFLNHEHDVLAQFQYLSSRTLPYDILTYPPGLEQLLMHCRVCHFLTETKGDLHAARTYVLREMKKGLSSPFDDMM
ncbi:hypothetical protein BGZ52_006784, partial [Haplosporangium bisporale]